MLWVSCAGNCIGIRKVTYDYVMQQALRLAACLFGSGLHDLNIGSDQHPVKGSGLRDWI